MLKSNPKLIKEVYDLLRHSMQPMRKLHVPYDVSAGGNNSKKSRKEGLIERFEAVKPKSILIDIDRAVYKSVNGTVTIDGNSGKISNDSWNYTDRENNKSAIKFPFFFEILAIPIKYCEDRYFKSQIKKDGLIFFGGVNYSTTPADSSAYFSDTTKESYTYGYNGKNADGLIELLRESGFAGDWYNEHYKIEPSKQKQPCVVLAHLVSPKVEYLAGYGKSFINLEPYADTIAKATVELAAKMPSKLTYDKQLRDMERLKAGKSKDSIVFYLTELLQTRWGTEYGSSGNSGHASSSESSLFTNIIQVRSRSGWKRRDLSILRIDPWTQSTVWYFLKPVLIAVGIPIKDSTREYVTSIIKDVCSKLEGSPTREELGIIASARAMLFFEGVWMSVDMDRVSELSEREQTLPS